MDFPRCSWRNRTFFNQDVDWLLLRGSRGQGRGADPESEVLHDRKSAADSGRRSVYHAGGTGPKIIVP
jgi:hypothetical protein